MKNETKKTISIGLLFFICIFILSFGIYFVLFRDTTSNTTIDLVDPDESVSNIDRRTFSPFGFFNDNSTEDTSTTTQKDPNLSVRQFSGNLTQITNQPIAGSHFLKTDGQTILQHIERGTGHIIETILSTSSPSTQTRLTNTTIPRIQNAFWITDTQMVLQYLQEETEIIETFLGKTTLQGTSTSGTLSGTFLPTDIKTITPNRDGSKLFYVQNRDNESIGTIYDTVSNKSEVIFVSPLQELLAEWNRSRTISLTTKPSSEALGATFFLDSVTGDTAHIETILAPGLTTLVSPLGNHIIYSSAREDFGLYLFSIQNNSIIELPLKTLPEKCTWSTKTQDIIYCAVPQDLLTNNLPDEWYQGGITFTDSIWKINIFTLESEPVINLNTTALPAFDAINLQLSPDESYVSFRNKKDHSLWLIKITEEQI